MKNTDGTIVTEIQTEAFEKIISNLKKANENDKAASLTAKYKDDNGTMKLISSSAQSSSLTAKSAAQITFQYRAHVTGKPENGHGWMPWYILGTPVGTMGESRRLEAMQFANGSYLTGFRARAHVQGHGWLNYVGLGEVVGTTGQERRAEAFQIIVPSDFATQVVYRVYVQNIGWMPYVNNGEIAGTVGQGLRVEAFQMNMVVIE
ncbi:hypothetical protein [Flavobacterium tyrosinilyticum]|uniref:hypothetical protein n=1 Tax=Flavobacterium tyrosinilyticum TaxID=1658740 RepID=UPI002030007F|nr:hypothetical protein [Flavobacterium tyrosinilyticum]MCM0666491.1 hypothetical protein [Flavobacterium tyrosinilyticum]